ncbi:MAG TPA: hypothetical protein VGG84_06985 [Gemmatimonadaceae bacterium]
MSAQQPPDPGIPQDRYDLPEKALGGADAVPDTNYVPTAEPEHPKGEGPVKARVPAGSGQGATWAIIAFLVIGAVLVFLLGLGQ